MMLAVKCCPLVNDCDFFLLLRVSLPFVAVNTVDTVELSSSVVLNLGSRDPLGVPNANLGGPKRKSEI